ncbi:retrovirus-related pol polyprotein from transposon TNT 1-94 [Tanacetum coccineum]
MKILQLSIQKHDELVKSVLTKSQFEGQLKEKSKVISDLKVKEEKDIDKMIEMDKQLKFLNEIVYTRNQSIQTIHMLAPKCSTYNGRPTFANPRYLKKAQSEKPCLYEIPYDTSDLANRFAPNREETMTLANESRSKLNKDYVKPYDYTKQNRVNHSTSVSRPPLKSYQVKDKVMPNNSQVKFNHKEVEEHHRISSISRKTKYVTACNDSSKSRTLNVNAVCAECGKCVFNSNHDACVSRYLNDVTARTKKPKKFHDQKGLFVEGLNHNFFSVGQFCAADLEVDFRKSTVFERQIVTTRVGILISPLLEEYYNLAQDFGFNLTAFSNDDHAGCIDTRKSTSGGIQFLSDKLVSWMSKKQNCTAMYSAKAEYVALSEHPSGTIVFNENGILLESDQNKLLVGDFEIYYGIKLVTTGYRFGQLMNSMV